MIETKYQRLQIFSLPRPSDVVLCSMKIAAMLARAKGRDFYDLMFLLVQSKPDYDIFFQNVVECITYRRSNR